MTIKELIQLVEIAMKEPEFSAKTLELLAPYMAEKSSDSVSDEVPKDVYKMGYKSACRDIANLIRTTPRD